MKDKIKINWLSKPETHDYPAAASYLSLIFDEKITTDVVKKLEAAPITHFKAKDIFRASGLSLLGISNLHVERDAKKIKKGVSLSPILLVRQPTLGRVLIADGYHRLCAVYQFNEDALIPCQIVQS